MSVNYSKIQTHGVPHEPYVVWLLPVDNYGTGLKKGQKKTYIGMEERPTIQKDKNPSKF